MSKGPAMGSSGSLRIGSRNGLNSCAIRIGCATSGFEFMLVVVVSARVRSVQLETAQTNSSKSHERAIIFCKLGIS